MKKIIIAVTFAIVAFQLTCAAPAPENEKKEAARAVPASETVDVSSGVAEAKVDAVGVTAGLENATPWIVRDEPKAPAAAGEKAQS